MRSMPPGASQFVHEALKRGTKVAISGGGRGLVTRYYRISILSAGSLITTKMSVMCRQPYE